MARARAAEDEQIDVELVIFEHEVLPELPQFPIAPLVNVTACMDPYNWP